MISVCRYHIGFATLLDGTLAASTTIKRLQYIRLLTKRVNGALESNGAFRHKPTL